MRFSNRCRTLFQILSIACFIFSPQLAGAGNTDSSVTLAWNPNPESDLAGYILHYGMASGRLDRRVPVDRSSTRTTLTDLPPGTWYCAVQAVNFRGLRSVLSEEISFTVTEIRGPEVAIEQKSGEAIDNGQSTISLGGLKLGAGFSQETFTIRNTGLEELTNLAISVTGGDFTVGAPSVDRLAPGASTTFTVIFRPLGYGSRTGTVTITSNDEVPFQIALKGSGYGSPKIAIERERGGTLTEGRAELFLGVTVPGTPGASEVLTIRNTGTALLTDLAASLSGMAADDFIFSEPEVTELEPGESTTVRVTFVPMASGVRTATLEIESDGLDRGSFEIRLIGAGFVVPKLAVTRTDGGGTAYSGNVTDFGALTVHTLSAAQVFTVTNRGTAPLTGLTLTLDGDATEDFVLEAPEETDLPPGASVTFAVSFRPSVRGVRQAMLYIESDDLDGDPLAIRLEGIGLGSPNIHIFRWTAPVMAAAPPMMARGATLPEMARSAAAPAAPVAPLGPDMGSAIVGSHGASAVFTIANTGSADLRNIAPTMAGAHAEDFVISGLTATTLPPGSQTTITVTFRPTAGGPRAAVLCVGSNDPHDNPFVLPLVGLGIGVPSAIVAFDDERVGNRQSIPFGSTDLGRTSPGKFFTITNTGSTVLENLQFATNGGDASAFLVKTYNLTSLKPGKSARFKINFRPIAVGPQVAAMEIRSSSTDQPIATFAVAGTGNALQSIDVVARVSRQRLESGSGILNLGDSRIGIGKSQILTIRNTGSKRLTGLSIRRSGIHAAEFSVSGLNVKSLAPGKSTTIKVRCKPAAMGARWATLKIVSDDPHVRQFEIMLTGNGVANPARTKPTKIPLAVKKPAAKPFTIQPAQAVVTTSVAVIRGQKFRSLTIDAGAISPADVQVSSDLLNWSSGNKHTTVVASSKDTLTVRDNTPIQLGHKRYIRIRPAALQ